MIGACVREEEVVPPSPAGGLCGVTVAQAVQRRDPGIKLTMHMANIGSLVSQGCATARAGLDASLAQAHIATMSMATYRAGIRRISVPGPARARVTFLRQLPAEDFRDALFRFVRRRGGF